ncbi:MAG TPA: hypothetical protein VGI04_03445 [Neobacillus sp.]|jgi:DNA-binding MurR/RpiR family transcriptional regulator
MTADHTSHLRTSLLHTLFSIINEENVGDSSYVLAHYFLEHYSELKDLNIFEVATDCFVSRSSVRRFCKAIGYENFIDMKLEFTRYDQVYYNNIKYAAQENYQQLLSFEINKMIQDITINVTGEVLKEMVESIDQSRYTIFLIPGAYNGAVKDFQEKMVAHHRVIYLISENYSENKLIQNLTKDDLLITLSTSGVFAEEASKFTKGLEGKKVLFTCNTEMSQGSFYDKTYYMSAQGQEELNIPVYSKYGINFMLDILYSEYVKEKKLPNRRS